MTVFDDIRAQAAAIGLRLPPGIGDTEIGIVVRTATARIVELARRDWAVRVLDAWCEVGQEGCETGSHATLRAPIGTWMCTLWEGYEGDQDERDWKADSAYAARLAAAESVWTELPESVRADLGERP